MGELQVDLCHISEPSSLFLIPWNVLLASPVRCPWSFGVYVYRRSLSLREERSTRVRLLSLLLKKTTSLGKSTRSFLEQTKMTSISFYILQKSKLPFALSIISNPDKLSITLSTQSPYQSISPDRIITHNYGSVRKAMVTGTWASLDRSRD